MNRFAETTRKMRGFALCATLALALGACAQQPRPGVRTAMVQQIGNEQQIEDVVSALKLGDVGRARKLLKTMTKRDPGDRRVMTLSEGLNGDPLKLLGSVSFAYRVEGGEQLTTLAQRFLGNRLKFYLLARYNGLTRDALQPGQILRIPGTVPAPKPRVDPRPDPRPVTAPSAPTPPKGAPSSPAPDLAAANQLRAQALAALNRGAVARAVGMLRRARALAPASVPIQRDLARAERLLGAVKARR